jgi:hypothetical protein
LDSRTGTLTPISLITVGLLLVLLASLAVVQSRGISTSPASSESPTLFEPKAGQISLFAPPYCSSGLVCRILDRVIAILRRVAARFPAAAPGLARAIAQIQAVQARLPAGGFFN